MNMVAELMYKPEFQDKVVMDLKGGVYCENTAYNPADGVAACQGFVDLIGAKAVSALGSLLQVSAARICGDLGCTK